MFKSLFSGCYWEEPFTRTLSFSSKEINSKYNPTTDEYYYQYMPPETIIEFIKRELSLYNETNDPISIQVVSNRDLDFKIKFTGKRESVNKFINNLSCHAYMIQYVTWYSL
jgi:hypothetical protein